MIKTFRYGWIILLFICQSLQAQKKYALIVGINDYYDAPGKLYIHSLKGCVNDAVSMKELLINRFGFADTDISMLLNGEATKKNLLEKCRQLLNKMEPGDAFVFYYSGHGVWMNNIHNQADQVKRGMSQAIVMSDLYSPNWNCLVRDETLKSIFNKFLDKKITTTTIMDCCYSANLMMSTRFDLFLMRSEDRGLSKDFDIRDLPYYSEEKQPAPCKGDSTDLIDSDGDGFYDCMDWEVHSPPGTVNEKGVCVEINAEAVYEQPDTLSAAMGFGRDSSAEEKAFDISKTVQDTVISVQARPVSRKGLGFVSIAATTDSQKGLEIVDMNGSRHGAFTAALIQLYNNNPADLPLDGIITGIKAIMEKQMYRQGPTIYYEGDRGRENLIGIKTGNERSRLQVKVINSLNGTVLLNKGQQAGIYPGNTFIGQGQKTVVITSVMGDSCKGKVINGVIRSGEMLELKNGEVRTAPKLKVFIPSVPITTAAYNEFMRKKILPITRDSNYVGPENQFEAYIGKIRFYSGADKFMETTPLMIYPTEKFMVFLPFPSFLAEGLKKYLSKDQNIQLVENATGADMVLFMSLQPRTAKESQAYTICFNTPDLMKMDYERTIFQPIKISLDHLDLKPAEMKKFYSDMEHMVWRYLRKKTTAWLNQYPRADFSF